MLILELLRKLGEVWQFRVYTVPLKLFQQRSEQFKLPVLLIHQWMLMERQLAYHYFKLERFILSLPR